MESEAMLAPATGTFTDFNPQEQSRLFSLPPELRYEIFSLALRTAPDPSYPSELDPICIRPGYECQTRTHTELLRTCKRIYMEAWFMPLVCSELPFYMARRDRSPKHLISIPTFRKCLKLITERHGKIEIGRVRLFAQLLALQDPEDLDDGIDDLEGLLLMENFHPRAVTLTIRYTDNWYWEEDEPLFIQAWGENIRFPASVTEFKIDLESLERTKREVDYITSEIADKWSFRRSDGALLKASGGESISVSRWTDSSMLDGSRWLRDETLPDQLKYYIGTVSFKPTTDLSSDESPDNPRVRVEGERQWTWPITPPSIPVSLLVAADIPEGSSAEDVKRLLDEYCYRTGRWADNDSTFYSEFSEDTDGELPLSEDEIEVFISSYQWRRDYSDNNV